MSRIANAVNWRGLAMLALIREAREALQHQTLYGTNNEALLIEFLRERLPSGWEVGSGEILRADGERSPQCDIIVYDRANYPPAFTSPSGTVVVVAHSVGAVVEVKSQLSSGQVNDPEKEGDVQALATQMNRLHDFLFSMHEKAEEQAVASERSLSNTLRARLRQREVNVYGFAYTASIQGSAILSALQNHLGGWSARVFVLDAPRSAKALKEQFEELLGDAPSVTDIRAYTDFQRHPNGTTFHSDLLGGQWVVHELQAPEGCLNNLARELMDENRARSALGDVLSPAEHEQVYSVYDSFAGLYGG